MKSVVTQTRVRLHLGQVLWRSGGWNFGAVIQGSHLVKRPVKSTLRKWHLNREREVSQGGNVMQVAICTMVLIFCCIIDLLLHLSSCLQWVKLLWGRACFWPIFLSPISRTEAYLGLWDYCLNRLRGHWRSQNPSAELRTLAVCRTLSTTSPELQGH